MAEAEFPHGREVLERFAPNFLKLYSTDLRYASIADLRSLQMLHIKAFAPDFAKRLQIEIERMKPPPEENNIPHDMTEPGVHLAPETLTHHSRRKRSRKTRLPGRTFRIEDPDDDHSDSTAAEESDSEDDINAAKRIRNKFKKLHDYLAEPKKLLTHAPFMPLKQVSEDLRWSVKRKRSSLTRGPMLRLAQLGGGEYKDCTKCGISKLKNCFYKDKGKKDGLYYCCKDCINAYRKENREKYLVYRKAYRARYKEKMAARYQANKQKSKATTVGNECDYKECSKCGLPKLKDLFSKHKASKDGLQSKCKGCVKAYNQEYQSSLKVAIAEQKASYYQENKVAIAEKYADYYKENKKREKVIKHLDCY